MENLVQIENGLVPIYKSDEGKQLVDARQLHEYLGSKRQFADWIKHRIADCDLVENKDYARISQICETSTGATTRIEYALTLDSAKHFALMERNKKGKQVRQYFIEAEERLREVVMPQLPQSLDEQVVYFASQAIRLTNEKKQLEAKVEQLAPKAESFDTFLTHEGTDTITAFAKVIGWGRTKLYDWLRENSIFYTQGRDTLPYQGYCNQGYFEVRYHQYGQGKHRAYPVITARGQEWLYRRLKGEGLAS